MGLFNFFRKKENPEAEAEAMFNEVVGKWMNDSNNNAKENEKIFKSYASNDSSVGLEENKPYFLLW